MAVEIERKYLVWEVPADLERYGRNPISQGYLAIEEGGTEVRVRRLGYAAYLTAKSGHGRAREEQEIEITVQQFERMWPLTEGRRVEKTRYELPVSDGLTAELDVYHGELTGLVTAEIEFPDAAAADRFIAPGWFGPEVTEDDRYKNRRLATDGLPRSGEVPEKG
jgi:CYTH domain-containing protein